MENDQESDLIHHGHVTNTMPFTLHHPNLLTNDTSLVMGHIPVYSEKGVSPTHRVQHAATGFPQAPFSDELPMAQTQSSSASTNYWTKSFMPPFSGESLKPLPSCSTATIGYTPLNAETVFLSPRRPLEPLTEHSSYLVHNPLGKGYFPINGQNGMVADPPFGGVVDEFHSEKGLRSSLPTSQSFPDSLHKDDTSHACERAFSFPVQSVVGDCSSRNQPSVPPSCPGIFGVWDLKTGQPVQESKKKRRPTPEERDNTRWMRANKACPRCSKHHRKVRLLCVAGTHSKSFAVPKIPSQLPETLVC